ncbi:MAG: hypothetical protein HFJ28_04350 [Clostridia bacterium]|nr:hypothetical protein [Clostridia bacterium]
MNSNSLNQIEESSVSNISDERKINIINLMFMFIKETDFTPSKEKMKNFQVLTQDERDFIDFVYDEICKLKIEGNVKDRAYQEELKDKLFDRFGVSKALVEKSRGEAKDRANKLQKDFYEQPGRQQDKADGVAIDAETKELGIIEESKNIGEACNTGEIRQDLYKPAFLCGQARDDKEKPFVNLLKCRPDNIVDHKYQFGDKSYTIRKTGELVYMPTPAMEDSISQYEIIIEGAFPTISVKRFGDISFNKMSNPAYSSAVFLGLIKDSNLTDESLHGYLGTLQPKRDEQGNLTSLYEIVHLPEEYTAVVIWEEIEKLRSEKQDKETKGSLGGDVR